MAGQVREAEQETGSTLSGLGASALFIATSQHPASGVLNRTGPQADNHTLQMLG